MKLRAVFQGAIAAGALLAVVGGGALGVCTVIDPSMEILPRLSLGYRHILFGFGVLAFFAVAASVVDALG
ncbi:MAG: hypothetical protein JO332_07855, partial [Planctomycetaceae bacterium]|nr:hypothetical protein [Planctomycetaceae bacterium]